MFRNLQVTIMLDKRTEQAPIGVMRDGTSVAIPSPFCGRMVLWRPLPHAGVKVPRERLGGGNVGCWSSGDGVIDDGISDYYGCLLYTSPSPRD